MTTVLQHVCLLQTPVFKQGPFSWRHRVVGNRACSCANSDRRNLNHLLLATTTGVSSAAWDDAQASRARDIDRRPQLQRRGPLPAIGAATTPTTVLGRGAARVDALPAGGRRPLAVRKQQSSGDDRRRRVAGRGARAGSLPQRTSDRRPDATAPQGFPAGTPADDGGQNRGLPTSRGLAWVSTLTTPRYGGRTHRPATGLLMFAGGTRGGSVLLKFRM